MIIAQYMMSDCVISCLGNIVYSCVKHKLSNRSETEIVLISIMALGALLRHCCTTTFSFITFIVVFHCNLNSAYVGILTLDLLSKKDALDHSDKSSPK